MKARGTERAPGAFQSIAIDTTPSRAYDALGVGPGLIRGRASSRARSGREHDDPRRRSERGARQARALGASHAVGPTVLPDPLVPWTRCVEAPSPVTDSAAKPIDPQPIPWWVLS